jgi:hypothetical protein
MWLSPFREVQATANYIVSAIPQLLSVKMGYQTSKFVAAMA